MRRGVATRRDSYLRKPSAADADEFVARVIASRDHLQPWVYGAEDVPAFRSWIARGQRADVEQFLVCRRADDAIAGFVNLNNISLGSLQSAAMGWAAFQTFTRQGHLRDGVAMVLELGFTQLRLHRIEANIQPGNARSRALAIGSGFSLEGFSPRYLKIGSEWCDHERWALLADDWRSRVRASR